MLKRFLFSFYFLFLATIEIASALTVEITQGNINPIPIALVPFKIKDPDKKSYAKKILKQVNKNLLATGLFKILPEKDFIENPEKMSAIPRFSDWRLLKIQGIATGKIIPSDKQDYLTLEFRLWDAFREKQIEGQALIGHKENWRKIAHKISNYIYNRLIGEAGHFDTKIAYVSESAPNTKHNKRRLAIMDFDGENHSYLTNNKTIVLTPRLSPTKPELVFMSYEKGTPQIFLLDLHTNKKRKLGNFPGMAFAPRFSPDGDKVIFSQSINGLSSIYKMNLINKRLTRLTRSPSIDTSPSYSPDGKKIVFNSDRSGSKQLYIMNSNGSGIQRISFGEGTYSTPVWSPRGDLIAFSKTYKSNFYIGVMKPNGHNERWLSSGYVVEAPSWAPNGRLLMYTKQTRGDKREPGGKSHVMMIDVTGHRGKTMRVPHQGSAPDWSSAHVFS